MITVDADKLQLCVDVSDEELASRKAAWKQPPLPATWLQRVRAAPQAAACL